MALPDFMIGDFQMETSEGFDEFMYEMGVNIFTRKIGNSLYPLQQISQHDGDITLETLTSFKNIKITFKLGTAWEEYTADGRYTQTVATLDDNKLIKVQTPDVSTGYHTTQEVREFKEDGKVMVLHLSIPAKPEIVCTRFYRRVEQVEQPGEPESSD
eukprot:GFUD01038054.1.p1 GENE.GFUD01038054.1~~GFUD01038054.1.p1  ORF type:complete len:157 (+),score=53.71 GFUD01038054.1:324-794(+)